MVVWAVSSVGRLSSEIRSSKRVVCRTIPLQRVFALAETSADTPRSSTDRITALISLGPSLVTLPDLRNTHGPLGRPTFSIAVAYPSLSGG